MFHLGSNREHVCFPYTDIWYVNADHYDDIEKY